MKSRPAYVYILTNRSGTLYVGVTSNLERRLAEHRGGIAESCTGRYKINRLLYYEESNSIAIAIGREKQIKGWTRERKLALVKEMNPKWRDLSEAWTE